VQWSLERQETARGEAVQMLQMERLGWQRRLQTDHVKCSGFNVLLLLSKYDEIFC
jgi:hypothetical protein